MIIKLREGASAPEYVEVRAMMGPVICTINIDEADIEKLATDPRVVSYERNKRLAVIG
jgi:hypothetical protein